MEVMFDMSGTNGEGFRRKLGEVLDYLEEGSEKKFEGMGEHKVESRVSTYNGFRHIQSIVQTLHQRLSTHHTTYRLLMFEYLPSSSFWDFPAHPKIHLECFTFHTNITVLKEISQKFDTLVVLEKEHCVEQLHFRLYELLQPSDNYYNFSADVKASKKYSCDLFHQSKFMVRNV